MTTNEYVLIFEQYRMKVFFFCKKILNHKEDAEDATSAVFIKLWEKKETITTAGIEAFLMTASKNKCLDHIRTSKHLKERELKYTEAEPPATLSEPHTEMLIHIHNTLRLLTPQQRMVFNLKFIEEKDYSYICALLNIKPQTAKTITYNALERIRKSINANKKGPI